MFTIDPAFHGSSEGVASLALCEARLQLDARFAWIVLIPRIDRAVEIEDLGAEERAMLMAEIVDAGVAVRAVGAALGRPVAKLNVGQLGNITRQLHVHVVGRRAGDPCWPGPVWGQGMPEAYTDEALEMALTAARDVLTG